MSVQHVNTTQFQALLENTQKPILVDFFATWCGPCRMLAPVLEELAEERNDIIIVKVDVDEEPALAQSFGIEVIPAMVLIANGKVSQPVTGYREKAFLNAMLDGVK